MACTQLLPSVPAGVRPCGREADWACPVLGTHGAPSAVLRSSARAIPNPNPNPNPDQERESGETFNVLNIQLTKGA